MDDATFLRNLAAQGRLAILADGTAVPAPQSVVTDESRAGSPFIIDLVSPEDTESGDGREFQAGTISVRDLPIPLMWQWQLDDGHKGAVIVGRIDYIEPTDKGLGNARGVFDSGPWGQEAERLVRARMLRGVSGDYTNFVAKVLSDEKEPHKAEAAGDNPLAPSPGEEIKDDNVLVTQSRLVSATLVSKPAFEGCYIRLADQEPDVTDIHPEDPDSVDYEDGVIEAAVPITAAALTAAGLDGMVRRLERLELIELRREESSLSLVASSLRSRVDQHRMHIERNSAVARVRGERLVASAAPPSARPVKPKVPVSPAHAHQLRRALQPRAATQSEAQLTGPVTDQNGTSLRVGDRVVAHLTEHNVVGVIAAGPDPDGDLQLISSDGTSFFVNPQKLVRVPGSDGTGAKRP